MELNKATVYATESCIWCERVIKLLEEHGYTNVKYIINTDIPLEEFNKLVPNTKTVPQVFINGTYIGGYNSVHSYLANK